jgi:hypothetical protein
MSMKHQCIMKTLFFNHLQEQLNKRPMFHVTRGNIIDRINGIAKLNMIVFD